MNTIAFYLFIYSWIFVYIANFDNFLW